MKKVAKGNKPINHSNKLEGTPNNPSQWIEYLNTKSLQMEPANDGFFRRFALELVTWAEENPKAYYIEQFCLLKHIYEDTYYEWVKTHECIRNAHHIAMGHLAIRNELILREKDPSSIRYMMPQLSKRWLKEDERRAEQKAKLAATQTNTNFKVNLDPIEETQEVTQQLKKKAKK